MFDEIDKRFECLIEVAKSNDLPIEMIDKAYLKAKESVGGMDESEAVR